jgi:tetratricopeptide (TPR) repeat protein
VDLLDPKVFSLHNYPIIWCARISALHDLGRDEEALEELDASQTPLLKAQILFDLGRFREVIDVLRHTDYYVTTWGAQYLLAVSSAILGDLDGATAVWEAALTRQDDPDQRRLLEGLLTLHRLFGAHLSHFAWLVSFGALAEARKFWNEQIRTLPPAEIISCLTLLINEGNHHFLRELIRESKLDDELLPMVVAVDYLETGDRSPLEKLSAEIRPLAEEIVAELQKKLPAPPERSMHKAHA